MDGEEEERPAAAGRFAFPPRNEVEGACRLGSRSVTPCFLEHVGKDFCFR
jgi:hypothetical protein